MRPGESYTTQLVLDSPPVARNPHLLIASPTNPAWVGLLLVGEENGLLRKKVFFRLPDVWFVLPFLKRAARAGGSSPCNNISLKTSFAPIRIALPENASHRVEAHTSFGHVTSDFPITVSGTGGGDSLNGTIGGGACQFAAQQQQLEHRNPKIGQVIPRMGIKEAVRLRGIALGYLTPQQFLVRRQSQRKARKCH